MSIGSSAHAGRRHLMCCLLNFLKGARCRSMKVRLTHLSLSRAVIPSHIDDPTHSSTKNNESCGSESLKRITHLKTLERGGRKR